MWDPTTAEDEQHISRGISKPDKQVMEREEDKEVVKQMIISLTFLRFRVTV